MPTKKATGVPKVARAVNLYWVTTSDHGEDWFIFAATDTQAARAHEDFEGYDRGNATTSLVIANVTLNKFAQGPPPCWAQFPDLEALGFEVLHRDEPRAVRLNGTTFVEGALESVLQLARDNMAEAMGHGRPNNTPPPSKPH